VLTITLNRPEVLNALNADVHAGLADALESARAPEVRAVVVTGAGRGFCVGQDLAEFQQAPDIRAALQTTYHPNVRAIRALEKPVIAAVNGPAAGAGLSLACACDVRIAADAASFVPAFINIGLVPDAGGAFFIARLLGVPRAFAWMASGRSLTAAEAHAWGIVSEVVEAAAFGERAAAVAAEWAERPTRGIGLTKRLFDYAGAATLDDVLELEAELQTDAATSDDFREGVDAFLAKRAPQFVGRGRAARQAAQSFAQASRPRAPARRSDRSSSAVASVTIRSISAWSPSSTASTMRFSVASVSSPVASHST
jgi:2-(1,2-epoxy-1,2-dihydrophenyl)acetyl-CoA isomerase